MDMVSTEQVRGVAVEVKVRLTIAEKHFQREAHVNSIGEAELPELAKTRRSAGSRTPSAAATTHQVPFAAALTRCSPSPPARLLRSRINNHLLEAHREGRAIEFPSE